MCSLSLLLREETGILILQKLWIRHRCDKGAFILELIKIAPRSFIGQICSKRFCPTVVWTLNGKVIVN